MQNNKIIVHGLWMGSTLGFLEKLTLDSFTSFGHEFHLWSYDKITQKVPKNVILRDAREMIPESMIFKYPSKMMLGFGGNTYVGFSEIFRYKVLYELGGWWSDMDVTCLKPLEEIQDEYFFRNHGVLSVVGNIMKTPPKSELMKLCYEKAVIEVNAKQDDWHHGIRILCYYIEYFGLSKYIHKNICNLDRLDKIQPYIYGEMTLDKIPQDWRFIHWMNSVLDKNYHPNSALANFVRKYSQIFFVI